MKKFKVEPVKDEDGLVIGVRAARVNDRDVIIALQDTPKQMNFDDAVKCNIPSLSEWLAISENIKKIDKVLEKLGEIPLRKDFYWSSSEYYYLSYGAWIVRPSDGNLDSHSKDDNNLRVRCKI